MRLKTIVEPVADFALAIVIGVLFAGLGVDYFS